MLVPSAFQNDVVVQPDTTIPHLDGQFFASRDLDSTLFTLSHVRESCRQGTIILSRMCDQLLIRRIGTLEFGNFSVQYMPQGRSQAIQLNVIYGKNQNQQPLILDSPHHFFSRSSRTDLHWRQAAQHSNST